MTSQNPREVGRVFVPASVDAWLDTVTEMDEASLPCNVSTVAYAVNAASLYRRAYRHMLAAFNEVVATDRKSITFQDAKERNGRHQ